jgi:hypothetical protein
VKRKLYTKSHSKNVLNNIGNYGQQFTSEEHAYAMEQEYDSKFNSKRSLIHWYLSQHANKLSALGFLMQYINDKGFNNIISLGSGPSVLEHLLKFALPKNANVVATDFDSYIVDRINVLLPNIVSAKFDFFKDDISELQSSLGITFDVVVFFGSAYVMDDDNFVSLFRNIRNAGIKQIIDFHGGYMSRKAMIITILSRLKSLLTGKHQEEYKGKFHGFGRSRSELRRIYKKAGVRLSEEIKITPYEYIAICDCSE